MPEPHDDRDLADLPAGAPVSAYLPDDAGVPPEYARPVGSPDRTHVDPVMVNALIADLDSIASSPRGLRPESAAPVASGLPGSDVEQACAAADAALTVALDALHSRFTGARYEVATSLDAYLAAEADNAADIGRAGGR